MFGRRAAFLLGWAILGLVAIVATAEQSNVSMFGAFVVASALAAVAFVAFRSFADQSFSSNQRSRPLAIARSRSSALGTVPSSV
jgi:ABC-type transport system involved in cytochrome c biogenesis permease subunit